MNVTPARAWRTLLAILVLAASASVLGQAPAGQTEPPEAAALKQLEWRSIGPANMGGRVTDIDGLPGNPDVIYVSGAAGGIHKSTNGGVTFTPIFEKAPVYSVGALEIAPSDPNVLYAGTGEGDPRNSASFGNGVYRSTDAGETWTHVGLDDTERIKRIAVDPRDPNRAFVCALGHAWGPNEQRGVFRTSDAGKIWEKKLYIDQDTGCSDIAIDLSNPRILYAGMYTFRRRPWRFDSGDGQTALYRSTDGGDTWHKLTSGLPKSPMDRIGVAVSASHPNIVYMITETKSDGVLFRSEDRGESWVKVNDNPQLTFRPFYYSDVRVDPNNPNRVFAVAGGLQVSDDGGRTFQRIANGVHGDHQALWIDPKNSNRILSGSDGGFQRSYDGGKTFEILNNVVLAQFYHVAYDQQQPYWVCGGLQDNGVWCGPSQTAYREGIRKDDWYTVSGGDGFFGVPHPTEPHLVYSNSHGGPLYLTDRRTGVSTMIHPYPKDLGATGSAIANYKYRFNWNSPIALSPHDPKTVYYGGNVLFKSTNYGKSWEVVSPDLTTNDKSKQQSSGGEIITDNTAAEFHCTILTIAESPVAPGVIWAGTDDGNIQVTRDSGKTWTNVVGNIKGLPPNSWVPAIEASPFDAGTAYVAVDRHRDNDFAPHAFKTTDYGKTWTVIRGNLPALGYVHVVREDPKQRNLLYAGTELGVFASWDGGQRWVSIRNNVPPAPVNDIQVHPREGDVILGTHGRGVWILDDASALRQLGDAMTRDAFLFEGRPAVRWNMWGRDGSLGQKTFQAGNPPYGAIIDFYVKAPTKDPVTILIKDRSGATIREIRQRDVRAGVNRAVWDLRHEGPRAAAAQDTGGFGGGGGRFGGGGGPPALPGEYTVTARIAGKELSRPLKVELDPRVEVPTAELRAQLEAGLALRKLTSRVNAMIDRVEDVQKQLAALAERLGAGRTRTITAGNSNGDGQQAGQGDAAEAVRTALGQARDLRFRLGRLPGEMGYRIQGRLREEIQSLSGAINSAFGAPTEPQTLRITEVTADTDKIGAEVNAFLGRMADLNKTLSGHPHIVTGAPVKYSPALARL